VWQRWRIVRTGWPLLPRTSRRLLRILRVVRLACQLVRESQSRVQVIAGRLSTGSKIRRSRVRFAAFVALGSLLACRC
jgi:hypothetical protein